MRVTGFCCTFATQDNRKVKRYFLILAYDGTDYHGSQSQPDARTIQGTTEQALSLLLRMPIALTFAGRTDAGVHARMMPAHFDVETEIDCMALAQKMNAILPNDIRVIDLKHVDDALHARFSATKRTYCYYVRLTPSPFDRRFVWTTRYALDFVRMNEAANYLLETSDFGAFCKSHTDVKTTICRVTEAKWVQTSEDTWFFRISADRFLRNMVRAVVGTLVDVGRGRLSLEQFKQVVDSRQRTQAGESMPANALFLEEVSYE